MTPLLFHLKASPPTPSSWVSCCFLLITSNFFLYHIWDSQALRKQYLFLREESINVIITNSLHCKFTKRWVCPVLICSHIPP